MTASALTKSSALLDLLNGLASEKNPSEFSIARVLREAAPLKTSAPEEYYVVEGIIESLRGHPDLVRGAFDKAIRLGGWDPTLALNYAVALHEAGDIPGAWSVIERGMTSFDSDPNYLRKATTVLVGTGALGKCALVEGILLKLRVEDDGQPWTSYCSALTDAGKSPDDYVGEVIRRAVAFVREKATPRPLIAYTWSRCSEDSIVLSFGLQVDLPAAEAFRLEQDLFAHIDSYVETSEIDLNPEDDSVLDWISIHIRSDVSNGESLHAA